jgi:hypothetical protein
VIIGCIVGLEGGAVLPVDAGNPLGAVFVGKILGIELVLPGT